MDFAIVPATVPQDCFKSYKVWGQEIELAEKNKSLNCTTRKATPTDWEKINSEIKRKNTITLSICDEVGVKKKEEKPPEHMYEAQKNRYRGKKNEPA